MKVCFVCAGNVFRSFSAERIAQHFVSDWDIQSAGTHMIPEDTCEGIEKILEVLDVQTQDHLPRQVSQEIINDVDVVVAMDTQNQVWLKENFGINVPLFFEIAWGIKCDVTDTDGVLDERTWDVNHQSYIFEIVLAIWASMPRFIKNVKNYST